MSLLAMFATLVTICVIIALVARVVSGEWIGAVVALVLSGIVAAFTFVVQYTSNYHNDRWVTCHVTEKDRGGTDGTYRVYTNECGTLSNNDSWFRFKTDSADIWQTIEAGQTYRLHVAGARVSQFSWFPNILEVQKVDG